MQDIFYVGWRVSEVTSSTMLSKTNNKILDKHHLTITYSDTFPNKKVEMNVELHKHFARIKAIELWPVNDTYFTVALLDDSYAVKRHNYLKSLGCSYDFPKYIPHITLAKGLDLRDECLSLIQLPIWYECEYIQFFKRS